ncbi:MAG: class I SAM-dependent methyltransferase [Candidatus Electrothrix sp. EH2]|nr:class I SAM-dependent methyltransferase [Candidatus Electrothrix sp. EH2]
MMNIDMIQTPDWNDLWKKKLLAASWRRHQKDPVAYFDSKAKWYNQVVMGRTNHAQEILPRLTVDHGCSVLDIGSGPGILSIPLAKTAGKVTAIDPSKQMIRYLKENAQQEGIKNITCLNKRWAKDGRISGWEKRLNIMILLSPPTLLPWWIFKKRLSK